MSVFLVLWISFLALSGGNFLLIKFGFPFANRIEEGAFSLALGFGLLGYAVLFLGLSGFLHPRVLLLVLGSLTVLMARIEGEWLRRSGRAFRGLAVLAAKDRKTFWLILFAAGVLALALLQSLLPPTAHDALCYHLYIPKRFVEEGRIAYFPYLVNSLFPFLIQMHYTLALLFKQPEAANIFHWVTGAGTFWGIVALGRRLHSNFTGLLAGLIFILTPGIFNQMVISYNDVALTFYSFMAFYAFLIFFENRNSVVWMALAGIFSGFALSVKYLALFHISGIGILFFLLMMARKVGGRKFITSLGVYGVFVFIFSFIWYLRSYLYEGNPVYPFFPSIFGGTGREYDFAKAGLGKGLLDFLLAGWRLTLSPGSFGGTWTQWGVTFLAFLPLIFFLDFKDRRLRLLGGFALLLFIFWFGSVQNLRFLFPLVPVLSILCALAARPFLGWLFLILILNAGFALYHGKEGYPYLLGRESRDGYLARTERTYSLSREINRRFSKEARILNMEEVRMFYFEPEMVRESEFRRKTGYADKVGSWEAMLSLLKEHGFTGLLVTDPTDKDEGRPSPGLRKFLSRSDFPDRRIIERYREKARDGFGYRLYELPDLISTEEN